MIKRIFPSDQYQVDIVESVLDDAVQSARRYEQLGYDVIISRGITCKMIRRAVTIPVVGIDITYFDILTALYDASLYGCRMDYLHYRGDAPPAADLGGMLRMLGIGPGRLRLHAFTNGEEVDRILGETAPGRSVILGTGLFVIDRAARLGYRTVMITSRREAFLNALNEARQLLNAIHRSGGPGPRMAADAPRAAAVRPRAMAPDSAFAARYSLGDLLGQSAAMEQLRKKITLYGPSDMTALICGESGTGKEIVANSLHGVSPRSGAPFVAINCAALPQSLLESELFGYEAGAFTGARREGHPGLFEQANGGTLFLDEISDLTLGAQAQLLRVLQEMTVRRVGGVRSIPLDVRVVAATNVDLWEQTQEGKFREDLFYRLNMLSLRIPPLRERREDIPLLFRAFVERCGGEKQIPVDSDGLSWLLQYGWPGNVRELLSFAQKFAMLWDETQDAAHLISELLEEFSLYRRRTPGAGRTEDRPCVTVPVGTLAEMEARILQELLRRYPGSRAQMAQDLGISRTSLWKKLKELGNRTDNL